MAPGVPARTRLESSIGRVSPHCIERVWPHPVLEGFGRTVLRVRNYGTPWKDDMTADRTALRVCRYGTPWKDDMTAYLRKRKTALPMSSARVQVWQTLVACYPCLGRI